jgi:hypothetical protein
MRLVQVSIGNSASKYLSVQWLLNLSNHRKRQKPGNLEPRNSCPETYLGNDLMTQKLEKLQVRNLLLNNYIIFQVLVKLSDRDIIIVGFQVSGNLETGGKPEYN